jgi:hypothetical protein
MRKPLEITLWLASIALIATVIVLGLYLLGAHP